jgi:hypothetical protein
MTWRCRDEHANIPRILDIGVSKIIRQPPDRKEVLTIGRDHRAFSLKQGQGSLPNALKVCKETGVQKVAVWERPFAEKKKVIMEGLQRDQILGSKMSHVPIMRKACLLTLCHPGNSCCTRSSTV